MSTSVVQQKSKLDRSGINRILQITAMIVVIAALLFGCAGRLAWWQAWAYLGIYLAGIAANAVWTLTHNPDVVNERGKMAENTKSWDKVISVFYLLSQLGTYALAGLDAHFGWSALPLGLNLLGALGFALSMVMIYWVMRANTFLSTYVRIQADRGQYVVTTGPYRYVRHPMYASLLLTSWAVPLLLGSWWSLAPSLLGLVVIVIRTALEDRTLQAELPGYADYARRVRYRLLPGVW